MNSSGKAKTLKLCADAQRDITRAGGRLDTAVLDRRSSASVHNQRDSTRAFWQDWYVRVGAQVNIVELPVIPVRIVTKEPVRAVRAVRMLGWRSIVLDISRCSARVARVDLDVHVQPPSSKRIRASSGLLNKRTAASKPTKLQVLPLILKSHGSRVSPTALCNLKTLESIAL